MAKPDRTIKIPGVSPEAPSCALLFRPCRLPDTCPPFSLREAWRFLIAHAVGISVRCRSFAPSWAVCTNPPFSPTAAPYPVTINLSPTRKDTTKRHWQRPLVTGCARDVSRVLEAVPLVRLHWKDRFGGMSRTRLLPRLENLPGLTNLRKTTCQVVFSFSELEITRRKKGSQEDPFCRQLIDDSRELNAYIQ